MLTLISIFGPVIIIKEHVQFLTGQIVNAFQFQVS